MCRTLRLPARSCRSSMFWVTTSSSPGQSRSRRASAACAAFGAIDGSLQLASTGVVEPVHQCGIAGEALRRRHVLEVHPRPDAVGAAKGVEPGFLRYAGAGQHDDGAGARRPREHRAVHDPPPARLYDLTTREAPVNSLCRRAADALPWRATSTSATSQSPGFASCGHRARKALIPASGTALASRTASPVQCGTAG